ncbi:MAG: DMT family transporter [Nanoarchaeota archaeon]|nr:DMT family transporter [Nanoarchaeota archaeon]
MQDLIGVLLIIVSGISFGAAAIFARFAYEAGTNPITLLFLRFGISSVCMLLLTLVRGTPFPRGRILLGLMLMGAVGYFGQSFCYFTALIFTSAGLVALLLYLYPAIVTVLAVVILREPVSTLKIAALVLALIGTALTIGPAGGGEPLGIALSLGAAFIYSVYILVGSKIMEQGTAIPSSTVIITSAAVMYGGLIAIKGASFPTTWFGWASVSAVALISTVLAVVTFLAGLERVGPTSAATLSTIEPVVTVILAALALDEAITPLRIAGGMMILLAVILLTRSRSAVKAGTSAT